MRINTSHKENNAEDITGSLLSARTETLSDRDHLPSQMIYTSDVGLIVVSPSKVCSLD